MGANDRHSHSSTDKKTFRRHEASRKSRPRRKGGSAALASQEKAKRSHLFARIVLRVDVIEAPWTQGIDLNHRLFVCVDIVGHTGRQ